MENFAIVQEVNGREQAELTQKFLFEIAEKIRRAENADDLLFAVAEAVGEHLQVRRCLFNEIDLERDRETVHRDYCRGVESVAGVHKISNYSPVTSADMQAGHTVINRDSQTDARTAEFYEQTYAPVGERAYIVVPLLRENHWVASLWVSDNEPRNWSDTEISLLETVGERAWLAVEKLRNETALRESEESYRILAETASDAIIRIDQNSTIEFVNKATERIFGYAPKEMVGQSLTMLMPEEMRQKHRAGFGRYLTTGKRNLRWESIEVPARHKDGHHFPLEISFGEYNRDGKRFFIGVARDISERRQAEKLLRESEERFAKAFNSSPLSITITSLDTGKLIEVNETFVEITGYSREEAIGRTTAELGLWQPNVRDAELETIKRKGQISNTEYQFRLKDGTEIVGLLSAELLEIGGEPCALTVIQDITTRKRAEELIRESEEKFRNLANSISQFAWMADASGYIFWFNERWFEYTGTTLEEMQGWDWQKVHHPAEVERVIVKFKRHIASGEIWEDTFPLRSKTGKYRWFLSRALPIRNEHGNIVRWFGTNTDIEEVRQARLQAEAANRLKDEFLATVSHELRTPLNAILGWSNMIQTGKANDETKIRANEIIYLNAKSQAALIEDLLDVSSIITGKMKLEPHPVKFALVVESAIDTIRSAADAKSIELETNIECEPCIIGGDAQRLQQVVWNLISNAVKFTPEGGKIAVKLENGNSRARLTIKDSGKGIEAEFLPYIFERFRQEDASSTRRHGGLGLGLAIVRHLVELHGGTISAMSAGENLGSTFTIELPLI